MNIKTLTRLISALVAGMLTLVIILGSSSAIQVDPDMVIQRPTQVSYIPTATLFPTAAPGMTTPTPVPPQATPTPASPVIEQCEIPEGWVPWQVQEGDSIYTLAWKAGVTTYILLQANCRSVTDLSTGDIIYLPPGALTTLTPEPYLCGPPPTWRIYYVQPGDTLFRLAINYGTRITTIQEANCLRGTSIYVGQALYLPPNQIRPHTPTPFTPGTPEVTLTLTFTPIPPTFTPTPGLTGTPTIVPPTLSPTATGTLVPTLTPTFSPVPTLTPTITPTPGATISPTPTATGETVTPTVSETPGADTPTPTGTPGTGTPTPTLGVTPTPTLPTPTGTTTATPATTTATTSPTVPPSVTAQPTPSATPTPTGITPTLSPTPSASPTPSVSPTPIP